MPFTKDLQMVFEEEELLKQRHFEDIPEYKAQVSFPVTTFSQFMSSKCHPEENGYFGATSGPPLIIQFGFEMEFTNLIDSRRALDVLDDHVMDHVLSGAFPTMCAIGRRRLSSNTSKTDTERVGKITGFAFEDIIPDELYMCDPLYGSSNICKVYSSQMAVFGRNLDKGISNQVLEYIHDALDNAPLTTSGALRITVVDDLVGEVSVPNYNQGLGALTIMGLVAAVLALILALVAVIAYKKQLDEEEDEHRNLKPVVGKEQPSWWNRLRQGRSTEETISRASTHESQLPSVEDPEEEYLELFRRRFSEEDETESVRDVSVISQLSFDH